MDRTSKLAVFALLSVGCIGCDRMTKGAACAELEGRAPVDLAGGLVRLEFAENTGAFLGLGGSLPEGWRFLALTVVTGMVLLGVAWFLVRRRDLDRWGCAGATLVVAGGVGNWIDRAASGYVVDFAMLTLGPLRTGVFNVADVAITAGALLLLVWGSGGRRRDAPRPS